MKKVYVIAEAGINHNGKLAIAKKLILAAKRAGANAVKFQTFIAEDVISKNCKMAEYQIKNLKTNTSMLNMIQRYQLKFGPL